MDNSQQSTQFQNFILGFISSGVTIIALGAFTTTFPRFFRPQVSPPISGGRIGVDTHAKSTFTLHSILE